MQHFAYNKKDTKKIERSSTVQYTGWKDEDRGCSELVRGGKGLRDKNIKRVKIKN